MKEVVKMSRPDLDRRHARVTLVVQVMQFLATVARAAAEWIDLLTR